MRLTLTIPVASPSLNDFANPGRSGRWQYKALRTLWYRLVRDALFEARAAQRRPLSWPRPPRHRVTVVVTRFTPAHQVLDLDNLMGGLKPVLDALKTCEVIADDASTAITLSADQAVSPHAQPQRWTEIRLSLEPPPPRGDQG